MYPLKDKLLRNNTADTGNAVQQRKAIKPMAIRFIGPEVSAVARTPVPSPPHAQ